jgi:molybdopterin/thiamine biosynthesis adenylyltransferase
LVPSCAEGGVLGVLPGIVGCIQANETLKLISASASRWWAASWCSTPCG